jgi:hypothetical protein
MSYDKSVYRSLVKNIPRIVLVSSPDTASRHNSKAWIQGKARLFIDAYFSAAFIYQPVPWLSFVYILEKADPGLNRSSMLMNDQQYKRLTIIDSPRSKERFIFCSPRVTSHA